MFGGPVSWCDSDEQTLTHSRAPLGLPPKTEFCVHRCLTKIFSVVNQEASAGTRVLIKKDNAGLRPSLTSPSFPPLFVGDYPASDGRRNKDNKPQLTHKNGTRAGGAPAPDHGRRGSPPQPGADLDVGTVQLRQCTRAAWRSFEKGVYGVSGNRVHQRSSFRRSLKNANKSVHPGAYHSKVIF